MRWLILTSIAQVREAQPLAERATKGRLALSFKALASGPRQQALIGLEIACNKSALGR